MSKKKINLEVTASVSPAYAEILSDEALTFIGALSQEFSPHVADILRKREERQKEIDAGQMPDFLPPQSEVENPAWQVCAIPADLADRRVEITGPTKNT